MNWQFTCEGESRLATDLKVKMKSGLVTDFILTGIKGIHELAIYMRGKVAWPLT